MKRTVWFFLLMASVCALTLVIGDSSTFAQQRPERPRPVVPPPPVVDPPTARLEVSVWTDKGNEEPTYFVGERIYVSFTVTSDAYLLLYDIDSTGNVNILFPNPYHPDNFVRKGRVYTIPGSNYDHDLFIKGPTGEEILFVVASNYAYYHWQYGSYPPPIWADEWGAPCTWGHCGSADQSIASRRFQQRLQFDQSANLAERTVNYIKHASDEIVKAYPVMYARCKFYVTIAPY